MVARNSSQTLCQTVAHDHVDADGMDEIFHFGRHVRACRWEDIGMFQSHHLAHEAEHRLVEHLIFQRQMQGRTLAVADIVHIIFLTDAQGMIEKFLLPCARAVHLVLDGLIDLFPKARHA